jgi:acyl carrier protein
MTETTETTVSAGLLATVQEAVADALGLDETDVTPSATLLGDLGAESIDLLDILFRIERKSGVKVQASDIGDQIQGGIPDDEFGDENEIVTAVGLAQMKKVMPQIDADELAGSLAADQVMSLFTVENLAGIVATKAEAATNATP